MFDIEKFLNLSNYYIEREDRRKGTGGTQEFFTPYSIVKRMCDKVSDEDWADPKKTVNTCLAKKALKHYALHMLKQ